MTKKHYLDIVIVKEKLSDGKPVYVAHCTSLGIASQGSTLEDARKNIKEAITLYLEEFPEKLVIPVPLHKELAKGTLLSIIHQAGLSREEFLTLL